MELRPDITVAAAKLTSGFDVSRELRQLGALLRDGEIVHRLAAGVYGSGGGLLAVTNRRVLLLRDGRGGQASEGFPLELLTSVEWVPGPARGTIIVGDAENSAELTQVEPVEGTSVVKLIRSLVPQDSYEDDGYEDDEYDEYDELAEAGEDALLTHGAPAMSGAGRRESGTRDSGGGQTSRSGRFAVTMKLRQPRDTPLGAPERSDSERSGSVRTASARTGSTRTGSTRTGSVGSATARSASVGTGSVGTGSGRTGPGRTGSGRSGADRLPEQKSGSEQSMPTRAVRRAAESERSGGVATEGRGTRSIRTSGGLPAGAVPVSALTGRAPVDLDRSASFPEQAYAEPQHSAARRSYPEPQAYAEPEPQAYPDPQPYPQPYPEAQPDPESHVHPEPRAHVEPPPAARTGGTRRARGTSSSGGHSAVPGVRSIEGSGALGSRLIGEVPVRKLAEETGGQGAVSRVDERPGRFADERGGFDDRLDSDRRDGDRRDGDRRAGRRDSDRLTDDRRGADRRGGRRQADRFADDGLADDGFEDDRFEDDREPVSRRLEDRRPGDRRPGRSDDRLEGRRGARFGPVSDGDPDRDLDGELDRDLGEAPRRFDERRPGRSEERRGARADDRRRTTYDEDSGEFRRTRTAVDTGSFGVGGSQRPRGDARSRSLLEDDHDSSRRSKWLWIGGVAAAVAALGAVGGVALLHHSDSPAAVNPAPAASDSLAGPVVRVTKVIDGDTIEVSGPVTGQVEIIGISAPRSDKGQCGATASTAFASRTLAGTSVTLVSDPSQPATDKSGRRLASLRTDNGFDYAVLAAGAGMARYYDSGTPVAQAQDIKNAQAEAEKAGRGLWGSPCNGRLSISDSGSSTAKKASTSTEGSTSSSSKQSSSPESDSTGTTGGSTR